MRVTKSRRPLSVKKTLGTPPRRRLSSRSAAAEAGDPDHGEGEADEANDEPDPGDHEQEDDPDHEHGDADADHGSRLPGSGGSETPSLSHS